MRILLNGVPMLGRATGVGQYGLHLLRALADAQTTAGIDAIGVFNGRHVVDVKDFLQSIDQRRGLAARRNLKNLVRRLVPNCRSWAERVWHFRLSQETRRERWSVLHETNFIALRCDLPLVTTVHDMGYRRCPQFMPKDRLNWLRRRMADSLGRSRVIVADSHFTRQEILELCPAADPARVVVVHLGVDVPNLSDPAHASRIAAVKRRYRLPERYVLYLGTLEPRKNLQGLARAYAALPSELQRAYPLVLAGMAGWNQSYFRSTLDELKGRGLLHTTGYIAQGDVSALMSAAEVFCFPSCYEGFGLPPLEAAACGTPVLSSNAASLPEVMGDAAVYVDPAAPEEITAGLERLLTDEALRNRLREAGPKRAALFTWQCCALETAALYRAAA